MAKFREWCKEHEVRAYGSIKMTTTPHFARCLRATRRIRPGEAIITCPYKSCFNFLTVAREQFDEETASSGFPLPLSWNNYADRLTFLKSTSVSELAMAGWMVRIASLENSPYTAYMHYLLEDTRGRDGIAHGLSKEREDDSGMVDHYFSELATDAGEDPEVFLENLFRAFACIHLRTQPIEAEAIRAFIPGTNFFKAKPNNMHVPTLMPLIDAVPQVEDDTHNTVVQYFSFDHILEKGAASVTGPAPDRSVLEACGLRALAAELFIAEDGMETERSAAGQSVSSWTEMRPPKSHGKSEPSSHEDSPLAASSVGMFSSSSSPSSSSSLSRQQSDLPFDPSKLRGGGLFVLRAIRPIEEGDVLYVRHFPAEGDAAQHGMNANVIEANRLLSHDN